MIPVAQAAVLLNDFDGVAVPKLPVKAEDELVGRGVEIPRWGGGAPHWILVKDPQTCSDNLMSTLALWTSRTYGFKP